MRWYLFRNMFANALKTNESLYFAVLTGCLINVAPSPPGSKIPRQVDEAGFPAKLENTSLSSQCQSIFTGLNNPKVHTISDVRYDEFFGFIDAEVDELLDFYGLTAHKEVFRDWYDGYRFGSVDVYCPWDVINYCDELLADPAAPPKNYWANTSGNELILRLLRNVDQTAKDQMEALLNGEAIVKVIRQELTYRDIEDSADNIWSVLYAAGYLTGEYVENADAEVFRLWIPNGEIRKLFAGLVQDWFREATRSDVSRINRFCEAFPVGDVPAIQEMLQDYLWESISIRDTAVQTNMQKV